MAPGVETLDSPTVRKTTLLWMDAAIIGTPAETTEQLAYELVNLDNRHAAVSATGTRIGRSLRRCDGGDYLETLLGELRRAASVGKSLTHACQCAGSAVLKAHCSDEARRFILRIADAFEDYFERAPRSQPDFPFATALAAIVTTAGINWIRPPSRVLDQDYIVLTFRRAYTRIL